MARNDARKACYKILIHLEKVFTNLVDAPYSDYEANLARRRFSRVDPDHRLVADTLEAEWNEKLRELRECREEYERRREEDRRVPGSPAARRRRRVGPARAAWR